MQVTGSVDAVIAAIRADADAEVERLRAAATDEIAKMRQVPGDSPPADRETRLNAARRRNADLAAQFEWEERRRFIEQREAWIKRAVERGEEILRNAGDAERSQSVQRLISEALEMVRGAEVEVRVAARDRGLAGDVALGPDAPIRGGCLARSGGLAFDNSFEERAKRLEPVWRKALAGMYRV